MIEIGKTYSYLPQRLEWASEKPDGVDMGLLPLGGMVKVTGLTNDKMRCYIENHDGLPCGVVNVESLRKLS